MAPMRVLLFVLVSPVLASCAFFTPLPDESSLDERLAAIPADGLPLKAPVTIYWDEHQIPYIEAEYDEDAAVALGMVHAHLRLGMIQLARRLSQGRLSEMVGPPGVDVDQAIRVLDFGHAVPEIIETMPDDTRRWLEAFVAGLNYYQAHVQRLPHEYRVMAFDIEPWTVEDLLTFGRLASSDANWTVWTTLLKLRDRDDWPELWPEIAGHGFQSLVSFDDMKLDDVDEVLAGYRIAGSNAIAVGPERSRSGAPLFSGDPHLGFLAPNVWLLAGVKSPSMHVVGLMPTGLPFFALGRNPNIAWGGTNMYAASSSFYDISQTEDAQISETTETIKVRFAPDRSITVRRSKWGPLISDLKNIADLDTPPIALRWMGHLPSDEVSAMLGANRATNFEEFRAAFGSYSVAGMNMMFADTNGDIGQVQAVRVPRRPKVLPPDIINPPDLVEPYWQSFADATTLPAGFNPAAGYLATANNRPAESDIPVGLVFSTDDRIGRIRQLMDEFGKLDLEDLKAMHRDVYMQAAVNVRDALVRKFDEYGIDEDARGDERLVLERIRDWDGYYRINSKGAVAFELFVHAFAERLYSEQFSSLDLTGLTDVIGADFKILADLETGERDTLEPALKGALAQAADRLAEFENWGDAHRLELFHPFAAIPLVGSSYRFGNYRFGGSTQTLMKAGHRRSGDNYAALYGASARFLSDLSDLDSNYFVLLGGQDGWFNSSTFLDQVPLWFKGEYIQMPLRPEVVQSRAARKTELRP